jgi:hypothetical protein
LQSLHELVRYGRLTADPALTSSPATVGQLLSAPAEPPPPDKPEIERYLGPIYPVRPGMPKAGLLDPRFVDWYLGK